MGGKGFRLKNRGASVWLVQRGLTGVWERDSTVDRTIVISMTTTTPVSVSAPCVPATVLQVLSPIDLVKWGAVVIPFSRWGN